MYASSSKETKEPKEARGNHKNGPTTHSLPSLGIARRAAQQALRLGLGSLLAPSGEALDEWRKAAEQLADGDSAGGRSIWV